MCPSNQKSRTVIGRTRKNVVRKSGTEPKIRIMGESHNKKLLQQAIQIVSKSIK